MHHRSPDIGASRTSPGARSLDGPRILVVSNLYPGPDFPAFGTFVASHVEDLRRGGATVSVAAIREDRLHRHVVRKYARLAFAAVGAAVHARLGGHGYDVVEAHIAFPTGLVAWPAARLGGARLVLFAHGSDVTRLPWGSSLRRAIARRLFHRADLIVATSGYIAGVAEDRLGPLRRTPMIVSPGVALPADDTSSGDGPRQGIVFVGRLAEGKGLGVLMAALARLPGIDPSMVDVPVTIVGDGPERAELEATAAGFGRPRVSFAGAVTPSEVAAILDRAAVVAVPSTVPEGLGLAALEGMAHGAIVVATDLGGLAETMRDGHNGFVVPALDDEALARALARAVLTAAGPDGDRLRAAGRETVATHDPDRGAARLLAAYRGLSA